MGEAASEVVADRSKYPRDLRGAVAKRFALFSTGNLLP
jgi:hypothetical protein